MPLDAAAGPASNELIERMRSKLGKLEVALGATQDSIAWTDSEGRIEWCNTAFERLIGLPHMAALGKSIATALPLDRWSAVPIAHPAKEVLESRSFSTQTIELSRGGETFYLEFFGSWAQGGGIGPIAVFVLRDVTLRMNADQNLRKKSQELARSNAELQQFASAASHDLMEPLRKVAAFGDLLRKRAGDTLDPTAKDFLSRMQQAAARMSTLIEDLLRFSRVFGDSRPFQRVDLGELAREVASDLERAIQASGAVVEIGPLPEIEAHPFQMRQLFQNLMANALKFKRADAPIRLAITSRPAEQGFIQLCFEDNGIGFEEKYADMIFQPFLRLHTRSEYEGSGLGLAICRRILLRHGGWITARGDPATGSIFLVTLPDRRAR